MTATNNGDDAREGLPGEDVLVLELVPLVEDVHELELSQWYDPDGNPCDPPESQRRPREQ